PGVARSRPRRAARRDGARQARRARAARGAAEDPRATDALDVRRRAGRPVARRKGVRMSAQSTHGGILWSSLEHTQLRDGTTGREELERLDRQVRNFVTEKPLMAVMLALAAGYVVGRIVSRI